MNPLIVFFFISMILEDFIFKNGMLLKFLIYFTIIYWILNLFISKSSLHTVYKKFSLAIYSQSYDPTVYLKLLLELKNVKEYINNYEKETGKRISITLFFTKAMAEVYKMHPQVNMSIRYGTFHQKKQVDIGVLVDMGGKDLANVTLRDIPNKKFSELTDELTACAGKLKQGKDEEFKKATGQFKNLPSFIIAFFIEAAGYLANIGINLKSMGIEANKFGTCIITSLGSFKLSNAYAPLCPFTYTNMVISICASQIKKILNKDGTVTEKELLPVYFASDHRYIDGVAGAKMIKDLRRFFENPELLSVK